MLIGSVFLWTIVSQKDTAFDPDIKSHYTLNYHTDFDTNVYGIDDQIDFSAKLDFRIFKKSENSFYAGFQLSDVDITMKNSDLAKQIASLYELFFLVKLDQDGKFLEYYFPRRDDDVKGLQALFAMLQAAKKESSSYRVEEIDFNGIYEALYQRDEQQLFKSRVKYREIGDENIDIVFKTSDINITLDNENNYIYSLKGYETLVTKNNEKTLLTNHNTVKMQKERTPVDETLAIWQEKRSVDAIIEAFKKRAEKYEPFWIVQQKEATIKHIEANQLDFSKYMQKIEKSHKVQKKINIQNFHELEEYLSLYPDEIEKLYSTIIDSDDQISMKLIHTLEKLGTQKAQNVLLDLIESDLKTLSQENHLRAIIAIGAIPDVAQENVSRLWRYAEKIETPELQEQSNTIVLALGSIASNSEETIANTINVALRNRLINGDDVSKNITLLSMQNSDVTLFQPEILDILKTSDNSQLQVTTIKVLQGIDNPEVESILFEKMSNTDNDYIKASAIEALSTLPTTDRVVQEIQNKITTQASSFARNEMVKYLAKSIDSYPQNRQYLQSVLKDETNKEIVKIIIKTIRKNDEKK